ncbi:hypothetical protein N9D23_04920 [Rubripirellula sp.]|nr:hypothetical protein [Rubripirellula sp.]
MILRFPGEDVLQLAITSEAIPREVSSAPVAAGWDVEGCVWLRPSVSIRRVDLAALRKLGVQQKRAGSVPTTTLQCWHQLLSLRSEEVNPGEQHEVLFCLDDGRQFSEIVNEMLRLGNDRQRFAWVADSRADVGEMCLLSVVDPPQYTLLRAIDASGGPVAFTSPVPRVWVEYGFQHPLVEWLQPPEGQWLLIRSDRSWRWIEAPALTDVYQALDFTPAGEVVSLPSNREPDRILVPVRLRESSSVDPAELWVVQADAMAQIESLLRRSDDGLLGRLAFAVTSGRMLDIPSQDEECPTVVLRARPSVLPPPELILDALACRPYLRIPNLFFPVGQQLQPPLRRDAVTRLLAEETDRVYWLAPSELESSENVPQRYLKAVRQEMQPAAGSFSLHSIEDAAFRPLEDWVEYVIDHQAQQLNAWIASHQFDFESFVCDDDETDQSSGPALRQQTESFAKRDESDSGENRQESRPLKANHSAASGMAVEQPTESSLLKRNDPDSPMESPPGLLSKPSQWQVRLRQLEERCRVSDEPLDSNARGELWVELGDMNALLNRPHDTTICFVNGLWCVDDVDAFASSPFQSWVQAWLHGELRCAGITDLDGAELDAKLTAGKADDHPIGLVLAKIVAAACSGGQANQIKMKQAQVVDYLMRHERSLPVRAAWLTWMAMYRINGNDLLLLARARDRLLQRLFDCGLAPEFDLPLFLRSNAAGESERLRQVCDHASELHQAVKSWVLEPEVSRCDPQTKGYVDLVFAYAMARLGETVSCQRMLAEATHALADKDAVHRWLLDAYSERIQQAFSGQSAGVEFSSDLMERLEEMSRGQRYVIDRLRQRSSVLEPHVAIDPFETFLERSGDDLSGELLELRRIQDSDLLGSCLDAMLLRYTDPTDRIRILPVALQVVPRLGERFARRLIGDVWTAVDHCEQAFAKANLLHHSFVIAAHFDLIDLVQKLVDMLGTVLPELVHEYISLTVADRSQVEAIETLISQSFQGMRRLGMRDEMGLLYRQLEESLSTHADLGKGEDQPNRLLLRIAAGWYFFGQKEAARAITGKVLIRLTGEARLDPPTARLLCGYLDAVGHAPVEEAIGQFLEVFAMNKGTVPKIANVSTSLTTDSHFSILHLEVVETAVMSLVSEGVSLTAETRRWLDEDEFLVRDRIHREMRVAEECGVA